MKFINKQSINDKSLIEMSIHRKSIKRKLHSTQTSGGTYPVPIGFIHKTVDQCFTNLMSVRSRLAPSSRYALSPFSFSPSGFALCTLQVM